MLFVAVKEIHQIDDRREQEQRVPLTLDLKLQA